MRHVYQIGEVYTTNNYGDVVIEDKKDGLCYIRFINTGYRTWVVPSRLKSRTIRDITVERVTPWFGTNIPFVSNSGSSGIIFAKCSSKVMVKFDKTGYIDECYLENVKKGKLKDPYERTFLGIGYLGEPKRVPYWKQAKQLWSNMMKRCYNEKDQRGYFLKGVTVDARWHCFANFLEDLPSIENFEGWLLGNEEGNVRYNLDKDYILEGNKVYSKHLCVFLDESTNKGMGKKGKTLINGEWVKGE